MHDDMLNNKKQKIDKKRKNQVLKGHHTSELRKLRNQCVGLRKEQEKIEKSLCKWKYK